MTDVDLESKLRRGLAGYAETVAPTPPPLDELLGRPAPRDQRRQLVLAGTGIAAATIAVVAVGVALARSDDHDVSTQATVPGACGNGWAEGRVVGRGTLPDGRAWSVETRGRPPEVGTWAEVAGEEVGGTEHNVWTWPGLVNRGSLSWNLSVFEGGQLAYGEVPPSTARVEIRLEDGRTVPACPIRVRDLDVVGYAATPLPEGSRIREIVAWDATGQRIARGNVGAMLPASLPEGGGYGFGIDVDPRRVDLPLGGVAAVDPSSVPLQDVVIDSLPGGEWSLQVGVVDAPRRRDYVVKLHLPDPTLDFTLAGTVDGELTTSMWHLMAIDQRLVVWGTTPQDVAEVVVHLDSGRTVAIPTQPSGVDGLDVRLFADNLPEGVQPESIEGRSSDGTVVRRATDVADALGALAGFPPGQMTDVPVDQVD